MVSQIQIVENVLKLNDEVAAFNRAQLREAGVLAIGVLGAPGCGKTALLEATLARFGGRERIGVLVGDLATTRDAERLARHAEHVVQINTGNGCHLDANQVRQSLGRLPLDALDVVFIENVGNLICPVNFDLGEDVKVGVLSVAEGDDKPAKHPQFVRAVEALVLNKIDLLPVVEFDRAAFERDIRRVHEDVTICPVSVTQGHLDAWFEWLEQRLSAHRTAEFATHT